MKVQLDTTASFHRVLPLYDDDISEQLTNICESADSVHASSYTKKEFLFSIIYDFCQLQARLYVSGSLMESYRYIKRVAYGSTRRAFRMVDALAFFVFTHYGQDVIDGDDAQKDSILAQKLFDYLHTIIPELWERFEDGVFQPLDDRTKCPFPRTGPIQEGDVYRVSPRKTGRWPCDGSEGCSLANMIGKQRKRAMKLLDKLRFIPNTDDTKTSELKTIQKFMQAFFQDNEQESCYKLCNAGIGDFIIAMETYPDRTLITTNAAEYDVICPAISLEHIILHRNRKNTDRQ